MTKVDRFAFTAIAFIAGMLFSFLFLAWSMPGFVAPSYQNDGYADHQQRSTDDQEHHEADRKPSIVDFIIRADTIPAWLNALFAIAGVGVSVWAVWLVRETMAATREVGRDQSRAYLHVEAADFYLGGKAAAPYAIVTVSNSGSTPAKWFSVVGTVKLHLSDHPLPFAIEIDPTQDFGAAWNALGGGNDLTVAIRSESETAKAIAAAEANPDAHMIVVSGFVRYETFFSEVFESEFMFVARPLPEFTPKPPRETRTTYHGTILSTTVHGEEPHAMKRAGRRLSSYKRIDKS